MKIKAKHDRMKGCHFEKEMRVIFVVLSKLDVSFFGKVVAEGKSKKKEESTVFSSCFFFLFFKNFHSHRTGFQSVSPHF